VPCDFDQCNTWCSRSQGTFGSCQTDALSGDCSCQCTDSPGTATCCNASSCPGCCNTSGACQLGTDPSNCGNGGALCTSPCPTGDTCQPSGTGGTCTPCPGCTDVNGVCQPGTDPSNCGNGNAMCAACPTGDACLPSDTSDAGTGGACVSSLSGTWSGTDTTTLCGVGCYSEPTGSSRSSSLTITQLQGGSSFTGVWTLGIYVVNVTGSASQSSLSFSYPAGYSPLYGQSTDLCSGSWSNTSLTFDCTWTLGDGEINEVTHDVLSR
jgi:hypothetical protein